MQLGQGDLDAGQLLLRIDVGGDPPAVVDDPAPAVGEQGDVDPGAVAGHGLVDRVVHDLPDQVVQPARTGRADVHAGPLADRLEALQDGHVAGAVAARTSRTVAFVLDLTCIAMGATFPTGGLGRLEAPPPEAKAAGQLPEIRYL